MRTRAVLSGSRSRAALNQIRSAAGLSQIVRPSRVIRRAVAGWRAQDYDGVSASIPDFSGNGFNAVNGGSKWLPYKPWGVNPDGTVTLAGSSSHRVVAEDRDVLRVTGDIELIAKVALTSWVSTGTKTIIGKWTNATARGYALQVVSGTGRLRLAWAPTATTHETRDSLVVPPATNGSPLWIKVTRAASTGLIQFFTSSDGVVWTQLGGDVAGPAGGIFASTAPLLLGELDTTLSNPATGRIYRAIVKNGINGTTVADFDASKIKSGPFYNDGLGNHWYGLGSAAWGDHAYLPGSPSNYPTAVDDARLDVTGDIDIRVLAGQPPSGVPRGLVSKYAFGANQRAYEFEHGISQLVLRVSLDGINGVGYTSNGPSLASLFSAGAPVWWRVTRKASTGEAAFFYSTDNGESWIQHGTAIGGTSGNIFSSSSHLAVGASQAGNASYYPGRIFRVQVFASIDGTDKRADVRFDKPLKWNNGQHTDPQGNVWTINRSALQSRLKVVANSHVEMFGGTDTIDTPDTSEFTIGAGDLDVRVKLYETVRQGTFASQRSDSSNAAWLFEENSATGLWRFLWHEPDNTQRSVGSTSAWLSLNTVKWVRATLRCNDGAGGHEVKFYTSDDGTAWTLHETLSAGAFTTSLKDSAAPLRLGTYNVASNPFDGRIYEAQVWKGIPGVSTSARLVANPKFTALTSYAPYKEPSYLNLPAPGGAVYGTHASIPATGLNLTGDLDVRWHGAIDDYALAGVEQTLGAQWNSQSGTNFRVFLFRITTAGLLTLYMSTDGQGGTQTQVTATSPVPMNDGTEMWFRFTRVAATGEITFYYSTDGTNWTSVGAVVGVTGALYSTTGAPITVGASANGTSPSANQLAGRVKRFSIRQVIDGSPVLDADFTNLVDGQAAFVEATGKTVTINGTARIERRTWTFTRASLSQRAELRTGRYAYLPGVNVSNYLQAPVDSAAGGFTTLTLRGRCVLDDVTSRKTFAGKWPGSGSEWLLYIEGKSLWFFGTTGALQSIAMPGVEVGKLVEFKLVVTLDGAGNATIQYYTGDGTGTSWTLFDTKTGAMTFPHQSTTPITLGAVSTTGNNPFNGRIYQFSVEYDGYTVAAFDLADAMLMPVEPHNGFTDLYGNVWTVNRATAEFRKTAIVDRPLFQGHYFDIGENDLFDLGYGTIIFVFRAHTIMEGHDRLMTKWWSNEPSWGLHGWHFGRNINFIIMDATGAQENLISPEYQLGVTTSVVAGKKPGNLKFIGLAKLGSALVTAEAAHGASFADLSNARSLRLMTNGQGESPFNDEFIGAALFKEVLTDAEIAEVLNEFNYDPELPSLIPA